MRERKKSERGRTTEKGRGRQEQGDIKKEMKWRIEARGVG